MPKKPKETKDASTITETFGGSPVTSNASPASEPKEEPVDNSFAARAARASIGLIKVDGIDFRYVGIAPARDRDVKTDSGVPITSMNTTFTPLSEVPFSPTIRVRIGDTFFFPQNATSWEGVEYDGKPLVEKA